MLLHLNPTVTNDNNICGVFAHNSMLSPAGTSSKKVFLSVLASKAKGQGLKSKSKLESVSSLGIP
ncbi:hypothetical protein HKD37_01G000579 [Glycine soja]